MSIKKILEELIGNHSQPCDCLYCRKGGKIDKAHQAILAEVEILFEDSFKKDKFGNTLEDVIKKSDKGLLKDNIRNFINLCLADIKEKLRNG